MVDQPQDIVDSPGDSRRAVVWGVLSIGFLGIVLGFAAINYARAAFSDPILADGDRRYARMGVALGVLGITVWSVNLVRYMIA